MQVPKISNFSNVKLQFNSNVYPTRLYHQNISYSQTDTVSFSGKSNDKLDNFKMTLRNMRLLENHGLRAADNLDNIEGLQNGLRTLENLDMHQITFLFDAFDEDRVSFPVVRGCHHNCSYCFLDAKAPIVRLKYEDFANVFKDLAKMSKRMNYKFENHWGEDLTLFYDSDGSEIYLLDKNNKVHEFPELNKLAYDILKKPGIFDTAGWNPKKRDIQDRMDRLVKYYSNFENSEEVSQICISLNPFEGIYNQSVMQRRVGNIKNADYLKSKYIEMAVNTLHTFSPLLYNPKFGIIYRAYPDSTPGDEYDGFRAFDMKELKYDILDAYREKYADELEENPERYEDLVGAFLVSTAGVVASGRDNSFKNYQSESIFPRIMDELSDKEFKDAATRKTALIIDTDGTVYAGDDFELCRTDIKLKFDHPVSKPIKPTPYEKVARFKKEE